MRDPSGEVVDIDRIAGVARRLRDQRVRAGTVEIEIRSQDGAKSVVPRRRHLAIDTAGADQQCRDRDLTGTPLGPVRPIRGAGKRGDESLQRAEHR